MAPTAAGLHQELSFAKILDEAHPDREVLYLPLKQSGKLLGYVHLVRGRSNGDKDPSEIQALSVLASQATASLENRKLYLQLEDAYLSSVKSLAKTLEYKDEYTHGHAERVADLCVKVGERMSLDKDSMKILFNAALLHDIGKIGVMESILNKTTKLDDHEWQTIRKHPEIGEEILKPLSSFDSEKKLIRHHHEREDGRGYPDGIYGNELSMLEKIIIVADSFDAMNSKRAYRTQLPAEVIKGELTKNKGTQFNPEVIDIFMEIYEEELTFQSKNGGALVLSFHPADMRKAS